MYANGLKALESMLDLSTNVTVKDLAIQFGCTPATELAVKTLQRYNTVHVLCIFTFSTKNTQEITILLILLSVGFILKIGLPV